MTRTRIPSLNAPTSFTLKVLIPFETSFLEFEMVSAYPRPIGPGGPINL